MDICGVHLGTKAVVVIGIASITLLGVVCGFAIPYSSNGDMSPGLNQFAAIIGWWYFFAWAVSFLPQLYLNYRRNCVVGQSFTYVFLNVLGFSAYSLYTICFFFVQQVQDEYQQRYGSPNNVQANDVAFAVYSLCCVVLNSWQIVNYDRGAQTIPKVTLGVIALVVSLFALWGIIIASGVHLAIFFNMLDWIYGVSVVKLAVSIAKYIPQVYLNYKRKLTVGWNIWNVLLDFSGGFLSVVQELMNSSQLSQIAGNPIKFALGTFSMLYDVIFMVQHYCLYRENNRRLHEREAEDRIWGVVRPSEGGTNGTHHHHSADGRPHPFGSSAGSSGHLAIGSTPQLFQPSFPVGASAAPLGQGTVIGVGATSVVYENRREIVA